jgi:uncharacterized protein (DUF427 family)
VPGTFRQMSRFGARPDNAGMGGPERIEPGPGQESVWDYPRPPRVEPTAKLAIVRFAGVTVAESRRCLRVLETASPPAIYFPPEDVHTNLLEPGEGATFCEWKGTASYRDVVVDERRAAEAVWTYLAPNRRYAELAGFLAFYPGRVDGCTMDGEAVRPQPGGYYGGWVTGDVVGPFKGERGTGGW